jgi:hypothetical protein
MIERLTGNLRWVRLYDDNHEPLGKRLQQETVDEHGKRSWREIPTVERHPEKMFD